MISVVIMRQTITNTLCEMFEDRGYDKSDISESDNKMFVGKNVVVYFFLESKVGVNHIKDIRAELGPIKHIVIVYKNSITSFAKQTIQELGVDGVDVEIFKDTELMFNVTKHVLTPKHEKISDQEKTDLLKKLYIRELNLPHIKKTDPVSKYMGLKHGDVVKIHRYSQISEHSMYYRICV